MDMFQKRSGRKEMILQNTRFFWNFNFSYDNYITVTCKGGYDNTNNKRESGREVMAKQLGSFTANQTFADSTRGHDRKFLLHAFALWNYSSK